MLSLMRQQTRLAHDGLQALQVAEEYRPHLIIMDIGMPQMNGYDACRALRARDWGGDMTIVALTGWGQEDDRRRSREAGFDTHLVKPVEPAALSHLVQDLSLRHS
jgi:CheY-like chemotaxis protein